MDASSRWLLGEMPQDGAADAHQVSALFDGNAKVVAHRHRQSVEVDGELLPLATEDSFSQITGDLSEEDQANLTASRGES